MPTYNVRAGYGEGGRMVRIYSFESESDAVAEAFVLERLTADPVELGADRGSLHASRGSELVRPVGTS